MNTTAIIEKLKQYPVACGSGLILVVLLLLVVLRGGLAAELTMKEAELNSRIRTIEENIKNASNLGEDVAALNALIEDIDSRLFNRQERAININFFYGLEDKAGVVISGISQLPQPDPIYADGGVRKLDLHSTLVYTINLRGSYTSVLRLLHELERADPLMRVADFQISSESSEVGGANIEARLRVLVLARKE